MSWLSLLGGLSHPNNTLTGGGIGTGQTTNTQTTGGSLLGIFGSLFSSGVLGNTIGSVFANGFNLSCWNVSSSPAEAQTWATNSLQPYVIQKSSELESYIAQKNVQLIGQKMTDLHRDMKVIYAHQMFHKSESNSSCSREGNQLKADAAMAMAQQVVNLASQMQNDFNITTNEIQINAVQAPFPQGISKNWKGKSNISATHNTYTVAIKDNISDVIGQPVTQTLSNLGKNPLMWFLMFGVLISWLAGFFKDDKNKKRVSQRQRRY